MKCSYSIGVDFGTNSCRALVVRLSDGAEIASDVFVYPSGDSGILGDPTDSMVARQNPQDYFDGLESSVRGALKLAYRVDSACSPDVIVGIGVDSTGSTPIPVDSFCTPLSMLPEFAGNLNAMAWLWKDHSSIVEADEITQVASLEFPELLGRCGGVYSPEWFWSKVLHCHRVAPDVFSAAATWVEQSDWLPALLVGCCDVGTLRRNVCAAGHKALFCSDWGGYPSVSFWAKVDSALVSVRESLAGEVVASNVSIGGLCSDWAQRFGLPVGIPIAAGLLDAHAGAVGGGCCEGQPVKILGTSTCDLMVMSLDCEWSPIPGISSVSDGSVIPGLLGIETGQAAVGDIFQWFVKRFVPTEGRSLGEIFDQLEDEAGSLTPGESGLLALDWVNGNRCILGDVLLSGLLVGESIHTRPCEVYRAWVEATAFGARKIFERVREYGVQVDSLIACGGLAVKSPFLVQIYADVLNVSISVPVSDQACALGAAFFGGVVGGAFDCVETAQRLVKMRERVYSPDAESVKRYDILYGLYTDLHDAFGTSREISLGHVMKTLIRLRG